MERSGWASFAGRGSRGAISLFALALGATLTGCDGKRPPNADLQEGYRLLQSDPRAAYEHFGKAQDASEPKVRIGKGLALEKLRRYEEAERILLEATAASKDPVALLALARVEVVLGKLDQARAHVNEVVGATPADLSAVLLEVCLANDEARARNALAHLDRWVELSRGQTRFPGELHLARASLLGQLKEGAAFQDAARKGAETKLSDARAALALVELATRAGRRDLAVSLLRKLHQETSDLELQRRIAELAHGLGDHALVGQILGKLPQDDAAVLGVRAEHELLTGNPRAEATLRRALEGATEEETEARLWALLVDALLRKGALDLARKEATALLQKHPSEGGAVVLARVDLAEGKAEAALGRLKPLLGGQPVPAVARELAATAHVQLKRPQDARPLLDALLKERPDHLRAARLRVRVELESGGAKDAARLARELVDRAPREVGLRLLLAETERQARGNDAAVESLRESVAAIDADARLWLALAQALDQAGKRAESLSVLEGATAKVPGAPLLTAALASRLAQAGQAPRAATLYESLLSSAKDDPIALNNLAMLYADELENAERAVELAERASELSKEPAIVDTLGWALFKRGSAADVKRSRELLESVRGKLTSPTSKYHLGAVLIAAGEAQEGKRLLRQALAQSGDFAEVESARELLAANP